MKVSGAQSFGILWSRRTTRFFFLSTELSAKIVRVLQGFDGRPEHHWRTSYKILYDCLTGYSVKDRGALQSRLEPNGATLLLGVAPRMTKLIC